MDRQISPLPATKVKVFVECANCHAKNTLEKLMVERPSPLEDELIEGVLICPDCGHESHCYFLSKTLRLARDVTDNLVRALSVNRIQKNLERIKDIREKYKNLFDEEQSKYRSILELSETVGQDDDRRTT